MNTKTYEFDTIIQRAPDQDGAYVAVPFDIRAKIGKQPEDSVRITIKKRG